MGQFNQVEDYDDLGQPIAFCFKGRTYNIPVPTPKKSKTLMSMGRDIQKQAKANERKIKEFEEKNEEIPDELAAEGDKLFDFQLDFILEAGIKEIDNETSAEKDVFKDFMEENWPNKLVQRIFRRINESFVESEQEKKS